MKREKESESECVSVLQMNSKREIDNNRRIVCVREREREKRCTGIALAEVGERRASAAVQIGHCVVC